MRLVGEIMCGSTLATKNRCREEAQLDRIASRMAEILPVDERSCMHKLRGWMLVDGTAATARSWVCGNRMSAGNEECYRSLGSPDPDTFIQNLGGDPAVGKSIDYGVCMAGTLDVLAYLMKERDLESFFETVNSSGAVGDPIRLVCSTGQQKAYNYCSFAAQDTKKHTFTVVLKLRTQKSL